MREIKAEEPKEEDVEKQVVPMGPPMNPMYMDRYLNIYRDNYFSTNRIIWFMDNLTAMAAQDIIKFLNFYNDGTGRPVYIYVCSDGGEVDIGFAIIDQIEALKKNGIPVYTICIGKCSSMASIILASGTKGKRYVYPRSRIMIHQPYYSECPDGSISGMNIYRTELEKSLEMMKALLIEASGKTEEEIDKALEYDHYMSAKEAKKLGLVDKVSSFVV